MISRVVYTFWLITFSNFYLTDSVGTGAQIQFSQRGLNFIANAGIQILNSKIPGITIPDVSSFTSERLKFTYDLSEIKIEQFNVPPSSNIIGMSPPDHFTINLGGISASINAHYKIKVKEGFIHVSKSGTVDASVSSTTIDASVAITSNNGHPFIQPVICNANFGAMKIEFHGDLLDDIIDLFKKEIERVIKEKLSGIICNELQSLETTEGNQFLGAIPLDEGLTGVFTGFHIDYGLTANPTATATSINIPIEGFFYFEGHQHDSAIPPANNVIFPTSDPHYLCIDFDADRVFGSAAYAFQKSSLSEFLINDNILKYFGDSVRNFFKCDCADKNCIGEIVPAIKANCIPGGSISIDANSILFPGFHFNSSGAYISATGKGGFQIETPKNVNMKLFDLEMDLGLLLNSDLKITNWKLTGDIALYDYELKVSNSAVGNINADVLQTIFKFALKDLVVGMANQILKEGIPLPQIPMATIVNPVFKFGSHSLSVCTDFTLAL
uniref:BPI1 domain-containing protein n=1 Tax=Rhabditophanes sp. KR3021 TaxID=114890 RepID=A0AC35TS58_9BILA